jgi:uncharacterized protein
VLSTVRSLGGVRLDLTNAVAPSADLVLWSRLGPSYRTPDLQRVVDGQWLVELQGWLRPVEDIVLYKAEMSEWPGTGELRQWQRYQRDWVSTNEACRLDILERLRSDGPLAARDLPDTCVEPWTSTGWNDKRNVVKMLDFLVQRGEVAVASRNGREPLWDLASRVYPDDPAVPAGDARRIRDGHRLRALGIARSGGPLCGAEPPGVGLQGEEAVVKGVPGSWRVDPSLLGQPFSGRVSLLSPFDRLVLDRKRMTELFQFDYQLEMYKPAASRRWGYFALPILYGDRLVGKLDASTDRRATVLRVAAIHRDVPFTKSMTEAVKREVRGLSRFLEVGLEMPA